MWRRVVTVTRTSEMRMILRMSCPSSARARASPRMASMGDIMDSIIIITIITTMMTRRVTVQSWQRMRVMRRRMQHMRRWSLGCGRTGPRPASDD
jgi:hypothetical protein